MGGVLGPFEDDRFPASTHTTELLMLIPLCPALRAINSIDTICCRDMNLTVNAEKDKDGRRRDAWAAVRIWTKAGRSRMKQLRVSGGKGLSRILWRHSLRATGQTLGSEWAYRRFCFWEDSRLGTSLNSSSLLA